MLDGGFGQFRDLLKWVCWKQGKYFATVDHKYTSQIFPKCGTHTGKKKLSERVHLCSECGYPIRLGIALIGIFYATSSPAVAFDRQRASFIEEKTFFLQKEISLKGFSGSGRDRHKLSPILIAAPENFNPELRQPPPPAPAPPEPPPILDETTPETEPSEPFMVLENLETDFRSDFDNFDQSNTIFEPRLQFSLPNDQRISFRTGYNTFSQSNIETVTNIPLQIGWEGKLGDFTLQVAGGIDFYNRLPVSPSLNARLDAPIFNNINIDGELESGLVLSGIVEQGAAKFNAETLENQISAWRVGTNLYWQIDSNTSFFTLYRWGFYSDRNYEQQSFSRLERKFGSFNVAANLFILSYSNDPGNGYFSPSDFLVYNGEVGWEDDIFEFLRCRLAVTLGQQRLSGEFDNALTYQTRCRVKFSRTVEVDLGYTYSNVQNRDAEASDYRNNSLTGQMRIKF